MIHQNNLHFVRFVLACIVVLGHAYALIDPQSTQNFWGHSFFVSLTALAVNAFFIISGFLIYQSLMRVSSFKQYIKSRLLRILPLYWLVIIITIPFCSLFFNGTFYAYFTQSNTWVYLLRNLSVLGLIHEIEGVFSYNPTHHINGSLWSIPYELICYFLFSFIYFFRNKWNEKSFSKLFLLSYLLLCILYLIIHFFECIPVPSFIETLSRCMLLFGTGMAIARFIPTHKLSSLIALFCFGLFIGLYYWRTSFTLSSAYTLFVFPFAYFILYLSFVPNKWLPQFAKYGDASYGIYLMAFPIQQMLVALFPQLHPLINFICTLIIVVPLAYLAWYKLESKVLKFK